MNIIELSTNVILIWLACATLCANSTLVLGPDGRFNNLLVYISDNVPENNGATLNNIKSVISEASRLLYNATKYMTKNMSSLSFGEVDIRIPESWNMKAHPITWQQCVKSEFKIVTKEMNGNTDKAFTKTLGKCGESGEFSRFSYTFFNASRSDQIRIKGKQLMAEFVKLRYGVFSEEPHMNALYAFDGNSFVQSSCPASIKWKVNKPASQCSDKNKICTYVIEPNQSHNYSIMFDTETHTTEFFCNDDTMPHNKEAMTLQNRKCKRQSISRVMLKHKDFNTSFNQTQYTMPKFRIIKAQQRKIVLVLDTSGSMYPVINATKRALNNFIKFSVEENAELGIVTFGTSAMIRSPMLVMHPYNRSQLVDIVNNLNIYGSTNIGHGLMLGVEVLGGDITTNDTLYGTIILLSDGENNEDDQINYQDAIANVIRKGIVTYAISYGADSDPDLMRLARETGGMFSHASFNSSESELFSKFSIRKSCDSSVKRQTTVNQGEIKIAEGQQLINFTYIDKFLGKDTVLDINFPYNISDKIIRLVDPRGVKIDPVSRHIDNKKSTLIFKISGVPQPGLYQLEIIPIRNLRYKRSVSTVPITFQVSSTPIGPSYTPEGSISTIFIDVVNGRSHVTLTVDLSSVSLGRFSKVEINVIMTYPSGSTLRSILTDDGLGDDSIERDGIFSRTIYARHLTEAGFYQFQGQVVMVERDNGETIRRIVDMESLRVNDVSIEAIPDKVAPATIQDLRVTLADKAKRSVKIEFSAPGDDSMTGTIIRYEARIKSKSHASTMTFIDRQDPYKRVVRELMLSMVNMNDRMAVSVRGVDDAGNRGEWSVWVSL